MMVLTQRADIEMQKEPETASQNENDRPIIDTEKAMYPAGRPATITIPELAPAGAFRHLTRHCCERIGIGSGCWQAFPQSMFDGVHEIGNIICHLTLQRMPPIIRECHP
jgi:hypothetical protein